MFQNYSRRYSRREQFVQVFLMEENMEKIKKICREAAEKVYEARQPNVADRAAMNAADLEAFVAARSAAGESTNFDFSESVDFASINYRKSKKEEQKEQKEERKLIISLDLFACVFLEAYREGDFIFINPLTGEIFSGDRSSKENLFLFDPREFASEFRTEFDFARNFVRSAREILRKKIEKTTGKKILLVD